MKAVSILVLSLISASCGNDHGNSFAGQNSDDSLPLILGAEVVSARSDEILITTGPSFAENWAKARQIVRSVCEGGFYSTSCADNFPYPKMSLSKDLLLPVYISIYVHSGDSPSEVFIQCQSDEFPPPTKLVEQCFNLLSNEALRN
jgi:hypothetical protein